MCLNGKILLIVEPFATYVPYLNKLMLRHYHNVPFLDLYRKATGRIITNDFLCNIKKKYPSIDILSTDRLQCTLQILNKFHITALDACQSPHIFCMNPITVDNYGEILKECEFIEIIPKYIIRYHTLVRSRTIARLKKEGFIRDDLNLQKSLLDFFKNWSDRHKYLENLPDSSTCILTVRLNVLQKYLSWRLSVTEDEFQKYCTHYLPLKHKPMCDIEEAINIAQNDLDLDNNTIKRNGFIISSDPVNTKLILKNIDTLAGMDIKEVIKNEPAILKNNYNSLIQIRNILEEYNISDEAQRKCLRIFCMCPETVRERLDELKTLKEYAILSSNPRVLGLIVHKKKMIARLNNIKAAKKQCYSLNHLVASSKVFNTYINSFGNRACGRDLATLIGASLHVEQNETESIISNRQAKMNSILKRLKRHKYWLHSALNVIDDNIKFLKRIFRDQVIYNNCHLLLYPPKEIELYINGLLQKRNGERNIIHHAEVDINYNNLEYSELTDDQILSLVLYQIEKKYQFSGDGMWSKTDDVKIDVQSR